jgi:cell division protein FtsZ
LESPTSALAETPVAKPKVKPAPPVITPPAPVQITSTEPKLSVAEIRSEPAATSAKEPKVDLANPLQLKTDPKHPVDQDELSFKKTPRGRFEGENPNVIDGEDLDLPPFLRKKK